MTKMVMKKMNLNFWVIAKIVQDWGRARHLVGVLDMGGMMITTLGLAMNT